ncbi:MAG: hypothetical protein Q4G30_06640 [Actinomycetaceae bacterium]|nr:hypothetical protein [Actinomycetaceae bacterium]
MLKARIGMAVATLVAAFAVMLAGVLPAFADEGIWGRSFDISFAGDRALGDNQAFFVDVSGVAPGSVTIVRLVKSSDGKTQEYPLANVVRGNTLVVPSLTAFASQPVPFASLPASYDKNPARVTMQARMPASGPQDKSSVCVLAYHSNGADISATPEEFEQYKTCTSSMYRLDVPKLINPSVSKLDEITINGKALSEGEADLGTSADTPVVIESDKAVPVGFKVTNDTGVNLTDVSIFAKVRSVYLDEKGEPAGPESDPERVLLTCKGASPGDKGVLKMPALNANDTLDCTATFNSSMAANVRYRVEVETSGSSTGAAASVQAHVSDSFVGLGGGVMAAAVPMPASPDAGEARTTTSIYVRTQSGPMEPVFTALPPPADLGMGADEEPLEPPFVPSSIQASGADAVPVTKNLELKSWNGNLPLLVAMGLDLGAIAICSMILIKVVLRTRRSVAAKINES